MPSSDLLAAVDLGSNSFRLLIGRVEDTSAGSQIYSLDSLKETVRLASGLTKEKRLDADSQQRALAVLERFGERLKSFSPQSVRAVATNTLRVAKNARELIVAGERALGFPIEVIAGREEARLIYTGVANTSPVGEGSTLVVDIGGGSTEFIIGEGQRPRLMESLFMGCVSYSLRFFPGGQIDKASLKLADLAAQKELEVIAHDYLESGWQHAIGSSGTARALADILESNGWSERGITRDGLAMLREQLLRAGHADKLRIEGLKPDRIPVIPGGFAIMWAVFRMLELERVEVSDGALRQGVLYDLLGRVQRHDMRDVTIGQFVQRYAVDATQARRVTDLALGLMRPLGRGDVEETEERERRVRAAGMLHEIGLSISHAGYHKHSAYIVSHADMPGFSRVEQARVSALVLGHVGKLSKVVEAITDEDEWLALLCLRIAALVHRHRTDVVDDAGLALGRRRGGFALRTDKEWLAAHPLTEYNLAQEVVEWEKLGRVLAIE